MKQLRISTPAREGRYQASKWLKWHVLCEEGELQELFCALGPFQLFPLSGFVDGKEIERARFLDSYRSWIEGLQRGHVPTSEELRPFAALACLCDPLAMWLQEVPNKGYLPHPAKPMLQIQPHFFSYSAVDEVFRPMSLGARSIFWGLQFSFPQIYQEGKTGEFCESDKEEIVRAVSLWVRNATRATPFVVAGKKTFTPIRLGKKCFSWIGHHPQLQREGISVHG